MADYSELADKLQHEVVTDMAESYFGDRKSLDDMIEAFGDMTNDLRDVMPRLYQSASRLFRLLLDREGVTRFSESLGITFEGLPFADDQPCTTPEPLPFALTTMGRYEKCIRAAYQHLRRQIQEYMHGRYYDHEGRKRVTMHYHRLKAVAEMINQRVERVNSDMTPSGTLRYVKKMDPVQSEREKVMGQACLVDGCGLDKDLQFAFIDFKGLGFPELNELPPLDEVRPSIKEYCKQIDPSRRQEIKDVMEALRDGSLIC